MNDDGRGLLADFVAAHFAAEDAARGRWLDSKLLSERIDEIEIPGVDLCKRGHNNWGKRRGGKDRKLRRYCKTCHAMGEAARRAS